MLLLGTLLDNLCLPSIVLVRAVSLSVLLSSSKKADTAELSGPSLAFFKGLVVGAVARALDEVVVRTTVVKVTLWGPDTVTLAASVDFSFLVAHAFSTWAV